MRTIKRLYTLSFTWPRIYNGYLESGKRFTVRQTSRRAIVAIEDEPQIDVDLAKAFIDFNSKGLDELLILANLTY